MTNKQDVVLTLDGFLELEEELNDLKLNKRSEVIKALQEARSLGDLSENADYDSARNDQAQLEGRIRELEYKLEHCTIVDKSNKKNQIGVGSTVLIEYVDDNSQEEYKIVGSLEADPFNNKISNESPIGSAILNKKIGDLVKVTSPNGDYEIKIVSIG